MNPSRPPGKGPGFVERESIRSSAALLLKVGEEVVGVMFVNYRTPHAFREREKQIIETFANSAAIAIQDTRQWENLKRTHDQLVQTEKMSAVGALASGVAHELKNPLSNILSTINVLERGYVAPPDLPAKLAAVKDEVGRAGQIIDNLLGFVRPPDAVRGAVDVLAMMNETLNLLGHQAQLAHVTVEPQLMPVPFVPGNPTLLKQVFFNIVRNAIEAMPEGGRLKIRTSADDVHVRVEVQDTGPGIPPDIRPHVFEPFFTTKEPGRGTGLGLAISYAIVHDHRGDIRIEDGDGGGTTFAVTLPIGD